MTGDNGSLHRIHDEMTACPFCGDSGKPYTWDDYDSHAHVVAINAGCARCHLVAVIIRPRADREKYRDVGYHGLHMLVAIKWNDYAVKRKAEMEQGRNR